VSPKLQKGTTTVEFAIVGAVLLTIMFAVIEFGRVLFTYAVLNEGTRRGARVAAVCPVNDPAIAQETAFASLPGLTTQNVAVEYLNQNGGMIGDPAGSFGAIEYVQVRIVNYQHPMWIPFLNLVLTVPDFAATLPRESLGVPRDGVITPC
jgi:TadE-like protein